MATRPAAESWLVCPFCGRPMLTVEIEVAAPPSVVVLSGCEKCGITSNEFAAPEPGSSGSLLRDYRRD